MIPFGSKKSYMTLFQVDAFTNKLFGGNPAAIIPVDNFPDDELMQQIALENNLSETAFIVPVADATADYFIRWFTPAVEMKLCGHATLAAAFVVFEKLDFEKQIVVFNSHSGHLTVKKEDQLLSMDFPSWEPEICNDPPLNLKNALGGINIKGLYCNRDLIVLLNAEKDVQNCEPDFALIAKTGYKIIITAPGDHTDFVSRFFAPTAGINEDPVTGSAHSQLIPFWAHRLNKQKMNAKQLSTRGGNLFCEYRGDRVIIAGECVFYMKGNIEIQAE